MAPGFPSEGEALGRAWLEHLSENDLRVLRGPAPPTRALAPAAVPRLLEDPAVLDRILPPPGTGPGPAGPPLTPMTPVLVFAAAIERTRIDLQDASSVTEWMGPRQRVPVLSTAGLRALLADPWHRLFLAELLASYTRVASGSVMVRTRRGWRRRRFSELDPVRLAEMLDVVPDTERPGVLRRLGDLALFLTGVFPDHTAIAGLGAHGEQRLLRATPAVIRESTPAGLPDPGAVGLLESLGRRWYAMAVRGVPAPHPRGLAVVAEVGEHFSDARRVLNLVTERHLFTARDQWFAPPAA